MRRSGGGRSPPGSGAGTSWSPCCPPRASSSNISTGATCSCREWRSPWGGSSARGPLARGTSTSIPPPCRTRWTWRSCGAGRRRRWPPWWQIWTNSTNSRTYGKKRAPRTECSSVRSRTAAPPAWRSTGWRTNGGRRRCAWTGWTWGRGSTPSPGPTGAASRPCCGCSRGAGPTSTPWTSAPPCASRTEKTGAEARGTSPCTPTGRRTPPPGAPPARRTPS
mmetsp:Transcript_31563/g.62534  ORF Transcript_31563/g.62534 Transcript_31563/m.62534 type:complete len:221 (+) Transcript_31563:797-1459(+)